MLVSSFVHCIAVLILQLWGVQTLSPIPACPASCICEKSLFVNCASLGLSKAPSHIPATATALDLSHNALHSLAPLWSGHMHLLGLQHLWVGNNSLESLSMCSGIQGTVGTRTVTRRKQLCVSWAPDLQSLSVNRNQLKRLPRGLGNIKSLKVLQVSHNRISEIGSADLSHCTNLSELYFQHNIINIIHAEAFKDLQKLKVLDVSYNLLATIPVPAYLSLRNLNVLVDISRNRWKCDCNLKTIRRWLSFDSELGNHVWEVVCFAPSHHSGKDLLFLEESDLACPQPVYNTPGVEKEITVDEGVEIILSCNTANQDFMHTRWWTPHGQISDSQKFLHISNTTEHDAGLYVCISGYQEEHVSVFNLHVRKKPHERRLRREAQIGSVELNREDNDNIQRNVPAVRTVQQSEFVLAVCLSVFITFIVAFVLGVILRPLLEKWYKQIRNKRNSTSSHSVSRTSSTGQRPYVNEGYSDTDEQEQEVHEGPRVTFGGVTEIQEQGGAPYYVTVEDSPTGSNTDVATLYENVEKKISLRKNIEVHKDMHQSQETKEISIPRCTENLNAESNKEMQFDYIPDPEDTTELEENWISTASSHSGKWQEPQVAYEARESTEQNIGSPAVSVHKQDEANKNHQATNLGLITDPFPLKISESKEECVDELDPDLWNDSGDSFSFSDNSPLSSSHVSPVGYPLIQNEMSIVELLNSEGGPTEYRVKPEPDEESATQISYTENNDINYSENRLSPVEDDILTEHHNTGIGAQLRQDTIILDPTDVCMTYTQEDSFDEEPFTDDNESFNSLNVSSDEEDEPTQYHVHPVYRTSQKTTSLMVKEGSHTSSCSEENEDNQGDYHNRLDTRLEDNVSSTDTTPVISPDRFLNIDYDKSSNSTDVENNGDKENDRGILKGPSTMLFNSGSETNKEAVQPKPNTATTNNKGTGGFLVLSFKKQEVKTSENVNLTRDDNFFVSIGQTFERLPKLKNYILFSISTPRPPHEQRSAPVIDRISEVQRPYVSSSSEDSYFGNIAQTLDPIPQVKTYLHFSQKSYPPIKGPPHYDEAEIIPNEVVKTESKKCTSSSEYDSTTNRRGNFFAQNPLMHASFNDQPKVKRYVQFSPSDSQLSNRSAPSAPVTQKARSEVISKTESPSDIINIFFDGQNISLHAIPSVQRYVQFKQSKPQTIQEFTPTIKGDRIFGQMHLTFDDQPKVKRYIHFSPSVSQFSSVPSAPVTHVARPEVVPKKQFPSEPISIFFEGQRISLCAIPKVQRYVQLTQSESQTIQEFTPTNKGDRIFEQLRISSDDQPKVKQYVQFSPSDSQLSHRSAPSARVTQMASSEVTSKTEFPSDTISIFFEGQSTSLYAIPKVPRYVQFMQFQPQTIQEFTLTSKGDNIFGQMHMNFDDQPKVKRYIQFSSSDTQLPKVQKYVQFTQSESQTIQEFTPTIKGDRIFGQMHLTFDDQPKVKRYIHFSPSVSQFSSVPSAPVTHVARPEVVSKKEFPSEPISIFFEGQRILLCAIPKVQRYVQLTQSESQTIQEFTPTIKGDRIFEQMHISCDAQPKIKRYVQFSPSDSQLSHRSAPSARVSQMARPEVTSKTESPSDTISIFFEGQRMLLHTIPKVQKYVQFAQSEPQAMHERTPTIKDDSIFEQMRISCDAQPKIKRYVQFSPSVSQLSNHSAPVTQMARTEVVSKSESPSDTISIFFEGQSISLRDLQKVQRYVQFAQSEPQTMHERTPTIKGDSIFEQMHTSFDDQPKVKQYVQFSPSDSQLSHRSAPSARVTQMASSEVTSKTEFPSDTISIFFEGQSTSLYAIPKVPRYVQFMQFQPQTIQEFTLTSKGDNIFGQMHMNFDDQPKVKRYIQFSSSDTQLPKVQKYVQFTQSESQTIQEFTPTIKGDRIFGQMHLTFDDQPKVKRYIHFSPSVSQFSSVPSAPVTHVARPEVVSKKEFPSEPISIFFEGQRILLCAIPKVQRYVQLTQSESQTIQEFTPTIKGDRIFEQMRISSDDQPKVKQYVQFSPSDSQLSHRSTPVTQMARTEIVSKSEFPSDTISIFFEGQSISFCAIPKVTRYVQFMHFEPQTIQEFTLTSKGDNIFGQIHMNFDDQPKVKRYIQFSLSVTQLSSHSAPVTHVARPEVVSKTEFPSEPISIFFEGQRISLCAIPKVQRYVQLTQSESQTIQEFTPTIKGDRIFGQIPISFNEMPKVKRHIVFSQSEFHYQPSKKKYPLTDKQRIQEIKTVLVTTEHAKPHNIGHHVFGQIAASLDGMPKVKNYIQFTKSEEFSETLSPCFSLNERLETIQASTEVKRNHTSSKEFDPVLEHNFFGQIGTLVDEIPKVRRRIQFTEHSPEPPEPYLPSSLKQIVTPAVTAKETSITISDVKSSQNANNFFELFHVSFDNIPKVKRSLQFTLFEAETSHQSIPSFFGQMDISFDEVPQVKKYLQFIESEPHPSARTATTLTKMLKSKAEVSLSIKRDNLFVQIGTCLQGLPKLKSYIHFTNSELQLSAQSLSPPFITECVTPELLTKMQFTRIENKFSPTIKEDNFFSQTCSIFDEIPKMKRYIQFRQTEPCLQPLFLQSTNRSGKTTHASSELKMKPAAGEHSFFGPIVASSEIPKLRRYIQFSKSSTQPSLDTQKSTTVFMKQELQRISMSPVPSKLNIKDTFFKKMDASTSELPKVKRYIKFSQQHSSPPKSSDSHVDTANQKELWEFDLSIVEAKPLVIEHNFFGQLGALPRVNRYIQVTLSAPYPLTLSQSATEKTTKKECKTFDTDARSSTKDTFLNGVSVSLVNVPKVKKAIQFTQSEYQNRTAANDKSSNSDLSEVRRYVQVMQSASYQLPPVPSKLLSHSNLESNQSFPFEEVCIPTKKENESFSQIAGVPKINRYIYFRQSEPHTDTVSPPFSSQKWEMMDIGTESRMFKTNVTSAAGDHVLQQLNPKPMKSLTNSDQYSRNQVQSLSWIQDVPTTVKATTETSRLNQLPEPGLHYCQTQRSPFSSKADTYGQPGQAFIQVEEGFRQTNSNSSSGDKKYAQGSSSWTALSTIDCETTFESKMPMDGSTNKSVALQKTKQLIMDPVLQNASQTITDHPLPSPEKDNAREYLRDSSLARQRQERRRLLFQQKRRAMAVFSLSSESFTSQESDQ